MFFGTIDLIDRLIGSDDALRQKFNDALRRQNGGDRRSQEAREIIRVNNINSDYKRPQGTSKAYALQKLSDEGQVELLEQVKSGEISANEAMKRAGFRRPRIAISLDDPESAVKSLLTHATPEFLDELRRLLSDGH
jgi:hypothetical protein